MLFKPKLIEKILKGEKTQTRRIVKPGERLTSYPDGRKVAVVGALPDVSRHIKWVVGKTYAIQPGRGKPAVGRIKLLDIRREQVRDISEADAIAEGVTTINNKPGQRVQDNPGVWVLTFELVREGD